MLVSVSIDRWLKAPSSSLSRRRECRLRDGGGGDSESKGSVTMQKADCRRLVMVGFPCVYVCNVCMPLLLLSFFSPFVLPPSPFLSFCWYRARRTAGLSCKRRTGEWGGGRKDAETHKRGEDAQASLSVRRPISAGCREVEASGARMGRADAARTSPPARLSACAFFSSLLRLGGVVSCACVISARSRQYFFLSPDDRHLWFSVVGLAVVGTSKKRNI